MNYEQQKIQVAVRAEFGHNWQAQRVAHFQMLGLRGPVDLNAKQIIARSLKRQGYGDKRKRRTGPFGC